MVTTDDQGGGRDTLDVARGALLVAVDDLRQIRNSVGHAQGFLNQYVHCDSEGGGFITDAGHEVNAMRLTMVRRYAYATDSVFGMLEGAADAIEACWQNFQSVDAAIADVTIRRLRVDLHEQSGPFDGMDPFDPGTTIYYAADTPEAMSVVSDGSYARSFRDPGHDRALTNAMGGLSDYREMQDKVSETFGLEFLLQPLKKFGIVNPVTGFRESMKGDYEQLGVAVAAVRALEGYWHDVSQDVGLVADKLAHYWRGEAADAAVRWLRSFAAAAREHADLIGEHTKEIFHKAVALKAQMDVFFRLVDDVVGLIPSGDDKLSELLDPIEWAKKGWHLVSAVDKALYAVDAVLTIGTAYVSLVSQARDDLVFPELSTPGRF